MLFTEKALGADLAPTTHPIQVTINHTADANQAFDAISYDKGACWIKTMDYFIGRNALQKGLVSYVQKFAFKNTKLTDLVTCLNESVQANGTGQEGDFGIWSDEWLKKSGVNTLQVELVSGDNIEIVQGFAKFGDKQLRSQRVDVQLWFDESSNMMLNGIMINKDSERTRINDQMSAE